MDKTEKTTLPAGLQGQSLDTQGFAENPADWFKRQSSVGDHTWLLAHADDGVIWGRFEDQKLLTSGEAFPDHSPKLDGVTLQQAYLFGTKAEVRVWRQGKTFMAYRLEETPILEKDAFSEQEYLLWGTQINKINKELGFTLLEDGRQGLLHAVPQIMLESDLKPDKLKRPLRLTMRHYINYTKDGEAFFIANRLVNLFQITRGK